MRYRTLITAVFVVPFMALALFGNLSCGDEAELAVDCFRVCEDYEDFAGDAFDVSACTDRCEDRYDVEGPTWFVRVDACEKCLEENEPSPGVFLCSAECEGVVP